MAEAKPELEKELSEIRREVIEARNLVIKTDNLVKSLHAELKIVGKRQEDVQKHLWMSSAASYFLFAVLAVAAAVLVYLARSSASRREREQLERSVAELRSQLDKHQSESETAKAAGRAAGEAYRQMNTLVGEDRLKAMDLLSKVNVGRLSPLERQALADRADVLRKEIGQSALDRGKAAFRKNDMRTTIAELNRFSSLNPPKAELLEASFYLGAAYNQTRQHKQAVLPLARFVEEEKRAKTRDYAMLLLSQSYEQTGQLERALEVARDALASYPNSEFATQLRGRIGSVKRTIAAAAVAPAAPKSPEPTPPASVPQR